MDEIENPSETWTYFVEAWNDVNPIHVCTYIGGMLQED